MILLNKIPPSVRPLGFVAIYRLVHKWLLVLFVPDPNSVPSLFTPALELRAGPLEDPSQEVYTEIRPTLGSAALSCLSREELAS